MITNSWYCSFITSFERKKIELKLPTPFCFLSFVFFSLIVLSVSNSHLIAVNCKIQKATGTFFYIKLADKSRLRGKIVCPINSLNALFQLSIKLIKQSQVAGIEIMILVNIFLPGSAVYNLANLIRCVPLCLPIIIILCMYQLKINLKNAKIFKGELGKYNLQSHSIPHILFDMCSWFWIASKLL